MMWEVTGYDVWMVDGDLARHLVWTVVMKEEYVDGEEMGPVDVI
jgi:hypothetical protein